MTKREFLGAALAVVLAGTPLSVSADEAKRVVIAERNMISVFDPTTGKGTQVGTFHAAGAISDTGLATSDFTVTPIGDGRAILKGDHVLSSAVGTLVVRSRVTLFPWGSQRVIAQGSWTIVGATGGYAGLEGRGKSLAVGDFTTFTVTIMRDGRVSRDSDVEDED